MVTTAFNALLVEAHAIEVLRSIFGPEIPVNIYDLGLVYAVTVGAHQAGANPGPVKTPPPPPPGPVAGSRPPEVEAKIKETPEVPEAKVHRFWAPPWNPDMMSEEAKLQL